MVEAATDAAELAARDAQAREQALDPTQSILLQAPAGSGKTTVLTQRFLRLLAEVDSPEEILAITFTRKAAAEMRERVFRALHEAAVDAPTDDGALSPAALRSKTLAKAALARSRAQGWSLESSPARLRIQTIDSLNRWLAAQLPVSARAAGDMGVIERPLSLYAQAARRTLLDAESDESLQDDVELLFERLDNDFGRFERLLTGMLQARSHWLPHLMGNAEPELRARVEESLRTIVAERLENALKVIPAALLEQGAHLARQAASNRRTEGHADGSWCAWIESIAGSTWSLNHWQGLCQLALTEQDTWRAALNKLQGFPTTDKALKAAAVQWLADMKSVRGVREVLAELSMLPQPTLQPEDAQALESLSRILKLAATELEVVFQEAARVDYPYIAAAARRALVERGTLTDLGLRLGTGIRHILVDEFQDTSIEQSALLEALTAGWDEGDGRTLFIVGDPMQSIYQFREAEVGLFLRTREHGLGSLQLTSLTLTRNFRSLPELVNWTNSVFPEVFPALDDPRAGAVRFLDSVPTRSGAVGSVHLHRISEGDGAAEAIRIADVIVRIRQDEPHARIAILITARPHAPPIVAALEAANVPVTGVDLVSLAELSVTRDLSALTRALDHLADRTAWLAILRAPWCGLTLSDLTALIGDNAHLTVWEAIHQEARVARLGETARARLLRVRSVLTEALRDRDRFELARWVERTWLKLGGPAACADEEELSHAQAFFSALARWSAEPDWTGPLSLNERLSDLYAEHSAAPADAVQIMTIHRAKGLEFDKVIVPGLGRRMRSSSEPLLRWLELPRDSGGSDLLMAAIPETARRGVEPLNEYLKSLQTRRALHERARLLYVAATRARSELHLFGELPDITEEESNPAPPAGTLLATLWPAIGAQFPREATRTTERAVANTLAPAGFERLSPDWRLPSIPAGPIAAGISIASYDAATESGPLEATARVVQHQLNRYARTGRVPEMDLREQLISTGVPDEDLDESAARAQQILTDCFADARLQWICSNEAAEAAAPLLLTGVHEGRLTSVAIDRSFIDENGVRWVIDFSALAASDAEVERLRPQWEKSLILARHLGPQPVRAGIYFAMSRTFREL